MAEGVVVVLKSVTQLFYLNLKKHLSMLIEPSNKNQIVITLSSKIDSFGLQRLIDYAKYLEATSTSKAKQVEVNKLADEVNVLWWNNNRKRFIK